MKILFVTELWPPHGGSFVLDQVNAVTPFVSATVAVLIPHPPGFSRYRHIRSRFSGKSEGPGVEHNIPIFYLRYRTLPELGRYLNCIQAARTLAEFLRRHNEKFDLIHAHFAYTAGFAAVRSARQKKNSAVITVHGSDINYYTRRHLRNFIAAGYTIWGLRHADAVHAVSQDLKSKVVALGVDSQRVTVIPNGIQAELFFPCRDKAALRRQLQLPESSIIFLYVGNFSRVKGLDILLNAFAHVQAELANAILLMIGDGELETELKQSAQMADFGKKIIWAGRKPHKEIPDWMNVADFLVLPSLSEGFGLVLLEALACGTPVIASAVGGVPEILTAPELGIMVPAGDSKKLAAAMLDAAGKSWDTKKFTAYAHANTWSARAPRFLQVYQTALGNQQRD